MKIIFFQVHQSLDFIEDAACQGMELTRILRVACLHSVISNGLKPKTLEMYRKLLLQAYGHVHLTSLINLEKSKLLCCNSKYFIVISRKKYLFILFLCEKKTFLQVIQRPLLQVMSIHC